MPNLLAAKEALERAPRGVHPKQPTNMHYYVSPSCTNYDRAKKIVYVSLRKLRRMIVNTDFHSTVDIVFSSLPLVCLSGGRRLDVGSKCGPDNLVIKSLCSSGLWVPHPNDKSAFDPEVKGNDGNDKTEESFENVDE